MNSMQDIGFAELIPAEQLSSTETGSAVDLAGTSSGQHNPFIGAGPGGRSFKAIQSCGAVTGTSPTCNTKIQYSADGSTGWTDIDGAVFTELTAAGREEIHFVSPERYVRAVATLAGTSPTFDLAVLLIGHERYSS